MECSYIVAEPDDELWRQYDELATRCFGHRVGDIAALRGYASARVAIRDGRVVAGGLGLPVRQFFGGKAVPSACLGAGCVAPEERGRRLADRLMAERVQAFARGRRRCCDGVDLVQRLRPASRLAGTGPGVRLDRDDGRSTRQFHRG